MVHTFFAGFADAKTVVPICSAMGFAYVLKHTGCDGHLVRLLTGPLCRASALLIPGTVLVGFLVNIPIISQTGTAVAVGTVLLPILAATRVSPITSGAALLLGSSIGGELLNQGAPEYATVLAEAKRLGVTGLSPHRCVASTLVPVLTQLGVATLVFWALTRMALGIAITPLHQAFARLTPRFHEESLRLRPALVGPRLDAAESVPDPVAERSP